MTYEELLQSLLPARRFGVVLGLERMQPFVDGKRLGRVVHVGGTNGKGSTVAVLVALARAAGLRVAAYTSPHLSSLRERIAFDGEAIDERALVDSAERVSARGADELTFFERITAIAFDAIDHRGVDLTVVEVGLGGRLDATNVVDAEVAVVTGVAMDHEAILGSTLAAIAAEKAGIFKSGQHVVIGASGEPAAVPWLVDAARAAGASTIDVIDDAAIDAVPATLSLVGGHQRRNAAAALAAWRRLGVACDERAALATVVHPGRFELIDGGDVILDGAHNPHGAAALAAALRERGVRPTLIIGVSADKDVRAIVDALLPVCDRVIATRYQQDRAMDPAALAALIPGAEAAPDLATALTRAGRPVVIAGSLFLVGEARTLLLNAPTDPFVVTESMTRRP